MHVGLKGPLTGACSQTLMGGLRLGLLWRPLNVFTEQCGFALGWESGDREGGKESEETRGFELL